MLQELPTFVVAKFYLSGFKAMMFILPIKPSVWFQTYEFEKGKDIKLRNWKNSRKVYYNIEITD